MYVDMQYVYRTIKYDYRPIYVCYNFFNKEQNLLQVITVCYTFVVMGIPVLLIDINLKVNNNNHHNRISLIFESFVSEYRSRRACACSLCGWCKQICHILYSIPNEVSSNDTSRSI